MSSFSKNPIEEVYGVSHILKPAVPAKQETIDDMKTLAEKVASCEKCGLSRGRTNPVFSDGDEKAELMFVGEGPGYDEDMQGKPFVGKAGKLLTKMIEAMQFSREEVYIANIVKCRPPDNRAPFRDEAEACIPYLYRQIEYVKPKVIVCLGSVATQYLLKTNTSISKMRGEFVDMNGIMVMPTYHPAYLLRSPNMKKFAWDDLQKVMAVLGKK
ncbi:MAG TPA: uracil-DNA glycosylase [Deferribacteraceae bacterium]|jgi:DNA polymerase|nr:uracil-DNA glycosylase [Deferribacteraceae bacterium]